MVKRGRSFVLAISENKNNLKPFFVTCRLWKRKQMMKMLSNRNSKILFQFFSTFFTSSISPDFLRPAGLKFLQIAVLDFLKFECSLQNGNLPETGQTKKSINLIRKNQ